MSTLYFHLVYRNYLLIKNINPHIDKYFIEPTALISFLQIMNLVTVLNIVDPYWSQRFDLDKIAIIGLSILILLLNFLFIRSFGFEKIRDLFESHNRSFRKLLDLMAIVYIFGSFTLLFITI